MELSKGTLVFVLGSVVFVGVGVFVSWFLLVGAGFGALGMFFVLPVVERFVRERKNRKLIKLRIEVSRLEREVGSG